MQDVSHDTTVARVLVTSERKLVDDCLSHHFATSSHRFELVATPSDASDPGLPMVCVMDVGRKEHSTSEKARIVARMRQIAPAARILVLSSHSDLWEASDWIASGAHGFFAARSGPALLTAATIVVASGGLFIPESLARMLLSRRPPASNDE